MSQEAENIKKQVVDSDLQWAYDSMIRHLRERTNFDADRVEQMLWERIADLKSMSPAPTH